MLETNNIPHQYDYLNDTHAHTNINAHTFTRKHFIYTSILASHTITLTRNTHTVTYNKPPLKRGKVGRVFLMRETQKRYSYCTPIKWCFVIHKHIRTYTHFKESITS